MASINDDDSMHDSDVEVHHVFSDEVSQVILSVMWAGNMLGAAYYDTETTQMYLMVDCYEEAPMFPMLHLLVKQVAPSFIITSSRTDERVLSILREMGSKNSDKSNTISNTDDSNEEEKCLHLLPTINFAFESCKHRLGNLSLPTMAKNITEAEKRIYLSTLIDFTNTCMVKAAGGLLKFLEQKRIGIQLEDEEAQSPIISISMFSLKDVVTIDDNTFSALQIFYQENHPSVYKCGRGMKEGLSLFGIFNRCKSAVGSKELRRWFLQPTNNIEIIQKRQTAIAYFMANKNMEVTNALHGYLKHITNVPRILSRMRTAEASINDWQTMYKTAYNAMLIGDTCRSQPQQIDIFKEISKAFTSDLFRIASLIQKIVDFDESTTQSHFVVKPGVDDQLDHMKRTYNGLPDFMTKVAYQELQQLNEDIQECSVIYLPQLGYLLAIPQTEQMKTEKDFHIEGLDFMFISNNVVHYKSASTRELDRLLGDTQCEITDHETQIMHRLQNVILEMSQVLLDVVKYSAKLDCLISLAIFAKECNYIQPELTNERMISIKKGRHPLQELCVASFVPNDTFSDGFHGKMKVLTGPNASGKSVYLKQVALIVYMAHIGSFVPAEIAKIPLVDHIFTRIQTLESVSISLSTFLIELNQISIALTYATEKSLVIIDEFGKGTEAKGGLALLTASLNFWLQKGPACPHVFVSTHFHSLYNLLLSTTLLQFQTMEVLKNEEELVFLYQLIEGRADGSFAHNAVLQAGLSKDLTERGMKISELLRSRQPIPPRDPKIVAERLKRYNSISDEFLKLDLESINVQEFLNRIGEATEISAVTQTTTEKSSGPMHSS